MITSNNDDDSGRTKSTSLAIGGEKGHVEESISGNLLRLWEARYRWKMIPRCTGRYTCRSHDEASNLPPLELLARSGILSLSSEGNDAQEGITDGNSNTECKMNEYVFHLAGRDEIIIVPLDKVNRTGLITYVKTEILEQDGKKDIDIDDNRRKSVTCKRYVHTLNALSGFRRKLEALGMSVTDDNIFVA